MPKQTSSLRAGGGVATVIFGRRVSRRHDLPLRCSRCQAQLSSRVGRYEGTGSSDHLTPNLEHLSVRKHTRWPLRLKKKVHLPSAHQTARQKSRLGLGFIPTARSLDPPIVTSLHRNPSNVPYSRRTGMLSLRDVSEAEHIQEVTQE